MRRYAAETATLAASSATRPETPPKPFHRFGVPGEGDSDRAFLDTIQVQGHDLLINDRNAEIVAVTARQAIGAESARVFEALAVALDGQGDFAAAWSATQTQLARYDAILAEHQRTLDALDAEAAELRQRVEARLAGKIEDPWHRSMFERQLRLLAAWNEAQDVQRLLRRKMLDVDALTLLKASMASVEEACAR